MVRVHVLQGERNLAKDNKSLAVFELVGIPPAPRGVPQIEVIFEIDSNGIVSAAAKDLATQREQSIKINPASGLTEVEIERIVEEAHQHAVDDERMRAMVETRNELEGLLYSTEKSFQYLGDRLNEEEKKRLEASLAQAREAIQTEDIQVIKDALSGLNDVTHKIAEMLYSGTAP
jgi:molecular chaperone DnaK